MIGGGPGGLEAARVLAERGHRVVVYEANPILGGQFALRASIPNWHEFQSVINWRIKQLERNQVRIELGRTIKASDIHELEVDVIVLATGARPKQQSIPGEEDSCIEVATPHDVILNVRPEADKVVVWDHGGGLIGAGVIEELVAKGKQVTVITPAFAVAEDVDLIQRVPFYERVLAAGTKFIANSRVSGFDGTNVVIENIYSRELTQLGPVDLLVSWQGSMAVDDLRPAIEASGIECHVIGDGLAPRTAEIAIAEGMLAARNIA
ncbi:MAG: FAD-dependent oxidoreductase [Pseudomonadota bacterium]